MPANRKSGNVRSAAQRQRYCRFERNGRFRQVQKISSLPKIRFAGSVVQLNQKIYNKAINLYSI